MLQLTHVTFKKRDKSFYKMLILHLKRVGFMVFLLSMALERRHCSVPLAILIPISSGNIAAPPSLFYYESIEWLDGNLSGMDYLRLIKNIWKSGLNLGDEIDYWEMSDYIRLPIRKYSLGMKQRLVIAMYFLSQAKCWLMDEITNGLDEYYRQKFFD